MSIIKGKTNIVAGFGGTKRCIGEVYFSQSSLASDNPGALPGWTGEYYENGKTLFPDLYNFVKAHSELQVTKTQYDSALATYGECPKYVVDENGGTTTETAYKFSDAEPSAFINIVKTQTPQAGDILYLMDATANEPYDLSTATQETIEAVTYSDAGALTSYTINGATMSVRGTVTAVSIIGTATSGTSLRLPKYANYIKMAGTEGITQKGAGLPNISGKWTGIFIEGTVLTPQGTGVFSSMQNSASVSAFGVTGYVNNPNWNLAENGEEGYTQLEFDASKSNAIYGASDTVTPAHTTLYPWISAYTSAVPASTAQAAEFTGALSGKANTDLSNVLANIDYVVEFQVNSDGSWYRKYKSGWLEQGGKLITGTGNYTFLKPYASLLNVTIQVMTTNGVDSTNAGAWLLSPGPTNTGFQILGNFDPTYYNSGYWYAVGQGAN